MLGVLLAAVACQGHCLAYHGSTGGIGNRVRALCGAVQYARDHNMSLVLDDGPRHGLAHIVNRASLGVGLAQPSGNCTVLGEYSVFRVLPFNHPLSVPLLPSIVERGILLLRRHNIEPPFACAHHRSFEKKSVPSFHAAFKAFSAQFPSHWPKLIIHDGHVVPRVPGAVTVGPDGRLHQHGEFYISRDMDTIASVVACSFASAILTRRDSTLGNMIDGLASNGALHVHYK